MNMEISPMIPSNAKVKKAYEVHLLSPQAPTLRVAGPLYRTMILLTFTKIS